MLLMGGDIKLPTAINMTDGGKNSKDRQKRHHGRRIRGKEKKGPDGPIRRDHIRSEGGSAVEVGRAQS